MIDDNAWHHVVATFDNGTIQIWIDGTNQSLTDTGVGSPAGSIHDNASSLQIAATNETENPIHRTNMRMFDRVLSTDEIGNTFLCAWVCRVRCGSMSHFYCNKHVSASRKFAIMAATDARPFPGRTPPS